MLLNQFFWPDTSATSQILSDAARFLNREHEVIVICSRGKDGGSCDDSKFADGVSIIRTRSTKFSRRTHQRVFSYLSYFASCFYRGLTNKRADVYVTLTTPPLLPLIGSLLSILRRSKHVIWEMDVYPDIATDIQYLKPDGLIARMSGFLLDWSRRRATTIIVLGEDMKDRLKARGIADKNIVMVENWADGDEIEPNEFPSGPLVIQYSGNLGLAHDVSTIQETIRQLANHLDFRFVFIGGGPRRQPLQDFCRSQGITNAEFRPHCERSGLGKSLSEGHVGLVTQIPKTLGSVVPSKTYGIMAAGRPVLFIGPARSTPARHIKKYRCGWHIEPGDVDALVSLLLRLRDDRQLIVEAGERARHAFDSNFNSEIGLASIKRVIESTSLSHQLSSPLKVTT